MFAGVFDSTVGKRGKVSRLSEEMQFTAPLGPPAAAANLATFVVLCLRADRQTDRREANKKCTS